MPKGKELTVRQQFFVKQYAASKNALRAYVKAYSREEDGYIPTDTVAGSEGFKLLKKPEIAKAVEKELVKLAKRLEVTQDKVVKEIARVAFADIRDLFDADENLVNIKKLPKDIACAIAGIDIKEDYEGGHYVGRTKKIKLNSKVKGLEMLARHLNLFDDTLSLKLGPEILNAILGALPEGLAEQVRSNLTANLSG